MKSPFNECHFSGTVVDDPNEFALYKVLGMDVFEKDIPPVVELEEKPKKKKKNDSSEGN